MRVRRLVVRLEGGGWTPDSAVELVRAAMGSLAADLAERPLEVAAGRRRIDRLQVTTSEPASGHPGDRAHPAGDPSALGAEVAGAVAAALALRVGR